MMAIYHLWVPNRDYHRGHQDVLLLPPSVSTSYQQENGIWFVNWSYTGAHRSNSSFIKEVVNQAAGQVSHFFLIIQLETNAFFQSASAGPREGYLLHCINILSASQVEKPAQW
jgi:hypothetical protein